MKLIECVPNFSEGRRPEVVAAIRDAIAGVAGAHILDTSADASHNRVRHHLRRARSTRVADAAFAGIASRPSAHRPHDPLRRASAHGRRRRRALHSARGRDDGGLHRPRPRARRARGARARHPRLPLRARRHAPRPREPRRRAPRRVRGAFAPRSGRRRSARPDFGPSAVHPTAGAVAIGARPFLVAYNVYLGPASNMPVAKEVAKAVRGSVGGLKYVKGLGFEVDGQAQVSMNLVDTEKTPLHQAYDMVKMEAEARGVTPTWSELVGLVPERVLFDAAARHVRLRNFSPDMVLERKVRAAITGGESLSGFVGSVASPTPHARRRQRGGPRRRARPRRWRRWSPASRWARRSTPRWTPRCASSPCAPRDSATPSPSLVARDAVGLRRSSPPRTSSPPKTRRSSATKTAKIDDALLHAAEVPLETARACAAGGRARAGGGRAGQHERRERRRRRRAARRGGLRGRRLQRAHQRQLAERQGARRRARGRGEGARRAHARPRTRTTEIVESACRPEPKANRCHPARVTRRVTSVGIFSHECHPARVTRRVTSVGIFGGCHPARVTQDDECRDLHPGRRRTSGGALHTRSPCGAFTARRTRHGLSPYAARPVAVHACHGLRRIAYGTTPGAFAE